jgi:RNA polymerase sigma factor (sigma-70 family)
LAGDNAAADEFVDRYWRFVGSVLMRCVRLSQVDFEEVFQQVWIHLWEDNYRRLRQWRGDGEFRSYLAALVRHLALDYASRIGAENRRDERNADDIEGKSNELPTPHRGPDQLMLVSELRRIIKEGLKHLKARDRELIERRHVGEQSYRDIADAMSLTVNHVGVALARAEERLRKNLSELYRELEW